MKAVWREICIIISLSFGIFVLGMILLNLPLIFAPSKTTATKTGSSASPTATPNPGTTTYKDPTLIVPALGVTAPIIFTASTSDRDILEDLKRGVVHYVNSAMPSEQGNVFIIGHSSNYPWEGGEYNYVFAFLNKLQPGDVAYIDFQSRRYVYTMTSKRAVEPSDLSVTARTNGHNLSLMTCYPTGTTSQRLIAFFELKEVDG